MKNKAKKVICWLLTFVIIASSLSILPFTLLKASAATVPSITIKYGRGAINYYPHANGVTVDPRNNHVYISCDRGVIMAGTITYTKMEATCVKYYNGVVYAYNQDKGPKGSSTIGTIYRRIVGIDTNPDVSGSGVYGSSDNEDYIGDIAFDSSGEIFFATERNLLRIKMQGQYAIPIDPYIYKYTDRMVDGYSGLAADNDRNVYVANCYTNEIEKFDPNGVCTVIAPVKAKHLVVDDNGNIYANGSGKLYRIDKLGNVVTIFSSGVSDNGICLFNDPDDTTDSHILIANSEENAIDEATFPTPVATSFSVSVDKSYTEFGTSATLTASGLPTAASGTVTFKNIDGTVLGTATVSNGTASCPTATTLPIGNYDDITAVYSGDVNYLGSSSTQSTALTVTGTAATTLTASVRDSSVAYGTPDTLTASVLPTDATGTVTFTDQDGKSLGTATVSNGTASCVTATNLSAETHSVTAAYSGDSTYAPSSATTSFTITPNDSTITLTESVPYAAMGSSDKVTFTVGNIPGNADTKVEFTATKAGESPISLYSTGVSAGNTSATYSPDMSAFIYGYGDYTITATFTDLSHKNASSAATVHLTLTGSGDAGFSLPSGIKTFNCNDPVVLTANTSQTTATGTVSFYNADYCNTFLGSAPLSHGTAQCTLSSGTFSAGTHHITAVYSGDYNYKGVAINDGYSVFISSTYSAAFSVSATTNPFVIRADNFPLDETGSVSFSYKQSSGSSTTIQSGVPITNGSAVYAVKNTLNSLSNGTYIITATYTPDNSAQSKYASTSQTAYLTITKAAPQITSADNAAFTFGSPGTFTVSTANYPVASLSETGTLPGGVTFTDNNDGTATIAGTPTDKGSYPITITASNGTSPDATQNFTLTVNPNNSMVFPATASFDKNTASNDYKDIPVTLALNGNTFSGIYNGVTEVESANYTVSADSSTVTLKKEYLAGLSTGDTALTFKFSAGSDATLTVTINVAPTDSSTANDAATLGLVGTSAASDKTDIATVSIADGKIAITSVSAGTATVTVTDASGHTATIPVTVHTDGSITLGTIAKYSVTFTATTDNSTANDTATLGLVGTSAASDKTDIATVSIAGSKIAITSVSAGTATITVTDASGHTATIPVTVHTDGSITLGTITKYSVTFTATTDNSTANDTATLGLVGTSAASDKTDIATVSIAGSKIAITSVSAGTATITVTDASGHTATIPVTVHTDGSITLGTITKYSVTTYTVTFKDYDGSTLKTQNVNAGNAATAPASPSRSGYTFTGWDKTFDNVTGDLTVTAQYSYNGNTGGAPTGGGISTSTSSNITVTTESNTTTASQTFAASTGSNGVAAASATSSQISEMLKAAEEKTASNAQTAVNLQVQTGTGATGVSVTLPQSAVTTLTSGEASLTVSSTVATVTLDSATLAEIGKQTSGDVTITATAADTSALSADTKTAIGTRPVYDLKITSGSTAVSSFGGGSATVSVPYTPGAGENVNAIVVYYINASGELVTVPNCVYDAKTGTVTFTTTHFSTYAVGYNNVSFSDVLGSAWYADYVAYLAARGIVSGNNGAFNPDEGITRAEFVTILARMSGDDLSGYKTSAFSDVSTDSWYLAAVQWANKAGIASGYDGKFNPNETITREQMAAMLYRYAAYKGTVSNTEGMSVREFSDYSSISSWAQAPIQWAMNNKILSGNTDGSFAPQSSATRAQAAKMLAVLMQGTVK